jgi:hypothetical protein
MGEPVSRHPITDGWKIAASLFAGPIAGLVVLGIVLAFLFTSCQKLADLDVELGEARDTVVVTKEVIRYRTDTLKVWLSKKARVDTLVRVQSDTTLLVRDSLIVVPPLVVTRIVTSDSALRSALGVIAADSAGFRAIERAHALELRRASAPRWGVGATIGYGCSPFACGPTVNVGLTYQAKLPNVRQLIRKVM